MTGPHDCINMGSKTSSRAKRFRQHTGRKITVLRPVSGCGQTGIPGMGRVPLQMHQLLATWAGDLPPWAEPTSRMRDTNGTTPLILSSLSRALRCPVGLLVSVYLPAAESQSRQGTAEGTRRRDLALDSVRHAHGMRRNLNAGLAMPMVSDAI